MLVRRCAIFALFLPLPAAAPVEPPMKPIATRTYRAEELARDFPPQFSNRNKQIAFDIACPKGAEFKGEITCTRWAAQPLPTKTPDQKLVVEARPDFFTYEPPAKNTAEWHLNFADRELFNYYAGGLLAQDELQVLEHPALGSLRRALQHDKLSTLVTQNGEATPILVQGVERRIQLDTQRSGLYGNAFSHAPADVVKAATTRLAPPTISNILAIEAPRGGHGNYTAQEIRSILTTAFTGFKAARIASAAADNPNLKVTIHTGFWGCGAYGGNRILMTALQLLAARMAEVDTLVFHAGDKPGVAQFNEAQKLVDDLLQTQPDNETLIRELTRRGFPWGQSDGN
jgi:hypothetical protein